MGAVVGLLVALFLKIQVIFESPAFQAPQMRERGESASLHRLQLPFSPLSWQL